MSERRPFVSRFERFESVDSTQRVVSEWLAAGLPEVAVAVADEQSEGRGRQARTWIAPPGAGLLVSVGFRPESLALGRAWQLGAIVSLAMVDAAEDVAGLRDGTLGLKWPNDLVADAADGALLKVAGVLGETVSEGPRVETAVVGVGVNGDWPRDRFPAELAGSMTSLRELGGGRPIDRAALLGGFLDRLEPRYEALRAGRFDSGGWSSRQRQTGRAVEVATGSRSISGQATGVDPVTGALILSTADGPVTVDSGEVVRCRVVEV